MGGGKIMELLTTLSIIIYTTAVVYLLYSTADNFSSKLMDNLTATIFVISLILDIFAVFYLISIIIKTW